MKLPESIRILYCTGTDDKLKTMEDTWPAERFKQFYGILNQFKRDNIISTLLLSEDKSIFNPQFGMVYRIENNEHGRSIVDVTDKDQLTDLFNRDDVTMKIRRLELFKKQYRDYLEKKLRSIFLVTYQKRLYDSMFRKIYTESLQAQTFAMEGFYGNEKSYSFIPHRDSDLVIMIPLTFNDGVNYKELFLFDKIEEYPAKSKIIELGDIVVMHSSVVHELKYHGKTDMISISFNYDFLDTLPDYVQSLYPI